jgi:hypothetical protein
LVSRGQALVDEYSYKQLMTLETQKSLYGEMSSLERCLVVMKIAAVMQSAMHVIPKLQG